MTQHRVLKQLEKGERINLLGLSRDAMEQFFLALGEKKFRAHQVMKWIHHRGAESIDDMTDVSKKLRERLVEIAEIRAPKIIKQLDAKDGCRKWLLEVDGGSAIETVFIPDGERGTLCVSSQVGCSLDCSFCATGKQGFNKDLTAAEIIGQVWLAAKSFDSLDPKKHRAVTNVVMMGMGEPLLNFDNVVDSMNTMMDDYGYGISKRRVTLSTSGVVPQLDRLADYTDASLAISLHAPNDEIRDVLVPINKKYPIARLLESSQNYIARMPDSNRKLTVEYTLIRDVNDQPEHARELGKLLKDIPCKINLIPFNPFDLSDYKKVRDHDLKTFQEILHKMGHVAPIRTTRGDDIDAACGQLSGAVNDRTRRAERYKSGQWQSGVEPVRIIEPKN